MDLWTISYLVLWTLVLAEAAVLLILLRTFGSFYLSTRQGIGRDGLALGTKAPDFRATRLDGSPVSLESFAGRWVLLYFAAPACEDCYRMLPSLADLHEELRGSAEIVVMFEGVLAEARAVPHLAANRLPVVAIGRDGIAASYKVRVSPFVQVLDPDGFVRAKGLGNSRDRLEHLLADAGLEHPVVLHHHTSAAEGGIGHHG
jgi:methylamine dehydrogenase accessory protein MauD